jgi:hypothetical protein
MTPPTLTPAEQIRRFVERHPGEWRLRYPGDVDGDMVLETVAGWLVLCPHGGRVAVTASKRGPDEADFCASDDERDAPILAQAAARIAEVCQAYNVAAEGLPPWLRDPVRRILRARAGELLTLAGSSPADVVSAAETLDEALCKRPVVEVTGVLRALMSMGMSCRWATGADEAADDYVGFVSRRLNVVAEERDGLAARMSAARAELARLDGAVTSEIMGEALWNLRRVLGVT